MGGQSHTEGPWFADGPDPLVVRCVAPDGGWNLITRVYGPRVPGDHWSVANARLIAAAPELLEAARAIVAAHENLFACGLPLEQGGETIDHGRLNEAAHLAQVAIRKATGESAA